MKAEARLLPQLNQLFTQKKSYQIHRKKIQTIKRSNSFSKKSINGSRMYNNQQDTRSQSNQNLQQLKVSEQTYTNDINNLEHIQMQTIQQAKPGLAYWMKKMNPLQKRIKQQQIKQNKRLRQKLKNTPSFVTKKGELQQHNLQFEGIKKRLSKFSSDQTTHKTSLKCQISLSKIAQTQKQKHKLVHSRIKSLQVLQKDKIFQNQSFQKLNNKNAQQKLSKASKHNLFSLTKISESSKNIFRKESRARTEKLNLSTNSQNKNKKIQQKQNNLLKLKSKIILNQNDSNKANTKKLLNISYQKIKIPNLQYTSNSRKIKTQSSQTFTELRKSNNYSNLSKISNQEHEIQGEILKNPLNSYKLWRATNRTQISQRSFNNLKNHPKIPKIQYELSYNRDKVQKMRKQNDAYKLIQNRIKTEGRQNIISSKRQSLLKQNMNLRDRLKNKMSPLNKQIKQANNNIMNKFTNKYDFQRKRIERFLTSKNSLNMKNQAQGRKNQSQKKLEYKFQLGQIEKQSNKQIKKDDQNEQNYNSTLLSKKRESSVKQEIVQQNSNNKNNSSWFATQVQ